MMQRFVAKKHNRFALFKLIICIILSIFVFWLTLSYLFKTTKIRDGINDYMIFKTGTSNIKIFNIDLLSPKEILSYSLVNNLNDTNDEEILDKDIIIEEPKYINNPIVYIYNTHDTEKYSTHLKSAYNITHMVKSASILLRDYLSTYGINAYVEEESTSKYLSNNNLPYVSSYIGSRYYLDKRIKEYSTLKYFIDIHRDSVDATIATSKIDDENYAKFLFVVGTDNKNYKNNMQFAELINSKLDKNLTRGIIKKGGSSVNGVYNQDISPNSILLEVGGVESTIEEVDNSMKVFAKVLSTIIKEG